MMKRKYLPYVVILFMLFCLTFAQSEDDNLNKRLNKILQQLQLKDARSHLLALFELEKMGTNAISVQSDLQKLLAKANDENKKAIEYALDIIKRYLPPQTLQKKFQKTTTKRSLASRVSKNLGGLNILGVSSDFRQRLRYGKRHALVIGINKYNKYYPELDGPNYDAGEVASVLSNRYGFENVVYLCDTIPANVYPQNELKEKTQSKFTPYGKTYTTKYNNTTIVVNPLITKKVIKEFLYQTFSKVGSNDAIFLFYAGHGVPGNIVATPENKNENGYISLTKVAKDLSQKNAKHTLMVLDCCFGGSLLQDKYKPKLQGYNNATFQFGTGENIDRLFARRSFQVISAGTGNEVVADKLSTSAKYAQLTDTSGHSPFSAVFLQALKGLVGRDDGIVLTSDLGYYMMTNLTNDKRLNAKQTPRYGSLGGDGDFMFFPAYKVLNPKLLAPLYLSDKVYADFRSSGCEALGKFINDYPEQDQISLTKSALPHIAKLLEDEELLPRKTALKFIQEKAQKHVREIKEFDDIVSVLTKYFSYQNKERKVIDLESFFSLKNQKQDEADLYEVVDCLGALHFYADEKAIDILKGYSNRLKLKWEKSSKDKAKPKRIQNKVDKLQELQKMISKKFQSQAQIYHQIVKEYHWLINTGIEELKLYENRMHLFLSKTDDPERKRAFDLLKDELKDSDCSKHFEVFKKYFGIRDQYLREEVLKYLKEKGKDMETLLRLLKEENKNVKEDIAKDLEKIGEKAFLAIVKELKRDKSKNRISKKLLFAFLTWEKVSFFKLIDKLNTQDQDFFIPILAEENFNDIYQTMIDVNQKEDIRSKAASVIARLDKKEPFIAHFFLSIDQRDRFDKQSAIDILTSKETVTEYSTITILLELLKHENENVRSSVANTLGEMGEKAHSAVPYLIPLLQDPHKNVRSSAAHVLGKIGEKAEQAIDDIVSLLQDRNSEVRKSAAEALGGIGQKARLTVKYLTPLLEDDLINVRTTVIKALGNIGGKAVVPALILALKDQDENVRFSAKLTLGGIGEKAVVPTLTLALRDQDRDMRKTVTKVLGNIGGKAVVPALTLALRDQDRDVREYAAGALGKIGEKAEKAVPALILALKDQDVYVKQSVVEALGDIGEKAEKAVTALIFLLKDKNDLVRRYTVNALGKIGEKAVPALILALKDQDVYVKQSVVEALGDIGEKAEKAVTALIFLLKDKNDLVRRYTVNALGKIGEKAAPALIRTLKDQDYGVRGYAADALGEIGEKAEEAVPVLIPLLKDQDWRVRSSAAGALGKIGEKAEEAVQALILLLEDQSEDVRESAVSALGEIGEKAEEAVPVLIPLLKDQDWMVRESVVSALGDIGKKAKKAVQALILLLKDEGNLRYLAMVALRKIGEKAEEAVPALILALKDQDLYEHEKTLS
ncbi:HEAT repeat-containing PBS lyase [Candidatus Uabimicrobium amorphum]|uniref:HEAT repeat-containing PBS lyase n=1 Tax=Uabimicrobium amorphum TaxID=2596890 RepID=A0A5S9IRL4_UABAM|nr:HEAT repeat domain-containing protein [Candidatus Uabimicrobium amorphum]BBM86171.1 HEAT repeat-containing PBS lyase [Candidatus Uabimicrobium amorphum]